MDGELAPVYDLNARRISPATLLRPNALLLETRRRAATGALVRDARLQFGTDGAGEFRVTIWRPSAA